MNERIDTFANLRLTRMEWVRSYLLRRPEILNRWPWLRPFPLSTPFLGGDFLLSHSWLPGMVELSGAQEQTLRQLIQGEATPETGPEHAGIARALRELGWLAGAPVDLDDLVAKAQHIYPAVQNPRELREFLQVVRERRPKVVVEIGTAAGGTFYCLSQLADPEALLVSIDYPGGPYGGGQSNIECKLFSTFGPATQRFEFIRDRSFHWHTLENLKKVLDGREVDLLFIDGDHSYAGVRSDYEMYHPLVAKDGLIAFHDILEIPSQVDQWQRGNDVAIFWRELGGRVKERREIIDRSFPPHPWDGREPLSCLWPPLGIGLVVGNP
jgi:predicted O-methyltransferase YrrM